LNVCCRNAGHLGQDSKLLTGVGCFEFLRMMHMEDGSARGYLNRSLPNLIITDFQNEEMLRIDPKNHLQSIPAQVAK